MTCVLPLGRPGFLGRESRPASPSSPAKKPCVSQTPSLLHQLPSKTAGIIDIRSSHASPLANLDSQILEGLAQPHGLKSLPSLMMWDEKGQTLYDEILDSKDYYPYWVEDKLLETRVDDIASKIAASRADLLVELGAGNMTKTSRILSSLDDCLSSPMIYYALDVDRAQLERSLLQLQQRTDLRWIKVCGLLGTYEDGAHWLARPELAAYRRTLIWMGSSIANFEQGVASEFLASYTQDSETGAPRNLAGVFLLVDGCQEAARIERAYDLPGGQSRRWMLYAIEAARGHLRGGDDDDAEVDNIFAGDGWRFEGQWHAEQQQYKNYLVPTRQLVGTIRGQLIRLERGERVNVLGSGKWTKRTMKRVGSMAGLQVQQSWHDAEFNYGAYWLELDMRRPPSPDSGIDMMEGQSDSGNESYSEAS